MRFPECVKACPEIIKMAETQKILIGLLEECELMLDEDYDGAAGLSSRIASAVDAVLQPNIKV